MVWFYIIIIITLLLSTGIAIYLATRSPKYDRISFKESLDLTDLPIITFMVGDKKCNFMLDTGANFSIINASVLDDILHTKTNEVGKIFGLEGKDQEVHYVTLNLSYKNTEYTEKMQAVAMDAAFNSVKQESGVTLHGILGNAFFQKYKYILDFNELVAYSKANK